MNEHFGDDELRAAYASRLAEPATAHGPECPGPDALLAAVRGEGPELERLRVLDHALRCPACRPELALLHATSGGGVRAPRMAVRGPRWRRIVPLALAATLVLAAIGVRQWHHERETVWRGGGTGDPALAAPVGGSDAPAGVVTFAWHPVAGALWYTLEVSTPDGANAFTARTVDTVLVAPLGAVAHGEYRWWVRVHLDDGSDRRSESRALRLR